MRRPLRRFLDAGMRLDKRAGVAAPRWRQTSRAGAQKAAGAPFLLGLLSLLALMNTRSTLEIVLAVLTAALLISASIWLWRRSTDLPDE